MQRTAASPLAKAGAICKVSSGLAVVVLQSPPLPLMLSLGSIMRIRTRLNFKLRLYE